MKRRLVWATLKAMDTADGNWRMQGTKAAPGNRYEVDLNSRRLMVWFNMPHQREFKCEMIDAYDHEAARFLPFPVELLEVDGGLNPVDGKQ